jgi:hypothetical protein
LRFEDRLQAAQITGAGQNDGQILTRILYPLAVECRFPFEDSLGVDGNGKSSTERGREGEEQLVGGLAVKSEDYGRTRAAGGEANGVWTAVDIQIDR